MIISYESLHLGSDAKLTAKGLYYLDLEGEYQDPANEILPDHDDREPTMLEFEEPRAGDRIDVAIYLASRDQDAQAGHNVTLNAGTVSIEPTWPEGIGTLVVDAYDTVSFGEAFRTYLGTSSNLHRIEVVSRVSDTLDDAQNYTPTYPLDDKLPFAHNANSIFDVWTEPEEPQGATELNKVYLLRGPKGDPFDLYVRAVELTRAEVAPLPVVSAPPLEEEEEIPVPKRKATVEIEAKYPGLLRFPVPNDPALASDVVLRKIAEHIQALDAVLREHQSRAMAALNERASEWLDVTWDAEGTARFEEQLAADPALAAWMSSAFDFVRTAKVRCGHSDDDSIGFFSQHLTLASDDAYDVVDAYLREKLGSMHTM